MGGNVPLPYFGNKWNCTFGRESGKPVAHFSTSFSIFFTHTYYFLGLYSFLILIHLSKLNIYFILCNLFPFIFTCYLSFISVSYYNHFFCRYMHISSFLLLSLLNLRYSPSVFLSLYHYLFLLPPF